MHYSIRRQSKGRAAVKVPTVGRSPGGCGIRETEKERVRRRRRRSKAERDREGGRKRRSIAIHGTGCVNTFRPGQLNNVSPPTHIQRQL